MGVTTILGLLAAFVLVVWGIAGHSGFSRVAMFLDFSSFLITVGCSFTSLLTNYTFKEVWSAIRSLRYAFLPKPPAPEKTVAVLVEMAAKARREGFLSLRQEAEKLGKENPLLRLGIGLIADGTDPEITRDIMETAAASQTGTLAADERIWRDMAIYAPMFGMLGTLIGLVLMLRGLSDPSTIGPAMSVALITTFYGVIMAGIIFIPLAGKIHNYSMRLSILRTITIEGLLSIQAGDNSQIVEERLKAHLLK
jgi:chemotaxis protein MotA